MAAVEVAVAVAVVAVGGGGGSEIDSRGDKAARGCGGVSQ